MTILLSPYNLETISKSSCNLETLYCDDNIDDETLHWKDKDDVIKWSDHLGLAFCSSNSLLCFINNTNWDAIV